MHHSEFANAYLFSGNLPSGTNAVVEVAHRLLLVCFHHFINMESNYATSTLPLFLPHRTLRAYIDKNGKLFSTWFSPAGQHVQVSGHVATHPKDIK